MPSEEGGEPHECVAETMRCNRLRSDMEPLWQANVASKKRDWMAHVTDYTDTHGGYTVVRQEGNEFATEKAERCEQLCSAQLLYEN